jgi:hypothetical protein
MKKLKKTTENLVHVVALKDLFVNDSPRRKSLTKGREYCVEITTDWEFYIFDDEGTPHHFSLDFVKEENLFELIYEKEQPTETIEPTKEAFELFIIKLGMWIEIKVDKIWVIGKIFDISDNGKIVWVETHIDTYSVRRLGDNLREIEK